MFLLTFFVYALFAVPVASISSMQTINMAKFSNVISNIAEVREVVVCDSVDVKGFEASKGKSRNSEQVYNYVAKGANITDEDGKSWIPYEMSKALSATYISPDIFAKDTHEVTNSPFMEPAPKTPTKVNTPNNKGIEASYFVTRNGDVFIWPPYEYDDALYVTSNQYICEESRDGIYKVGQGDPVSYDDVKLEDIKGIIFEEKNYDYANGKYVTYDGVTVLIDSEHAEPQISINSITDASVLEKTPAVYYKDTPNAKSPVGLETNEMYNGK